METIDLLEAAKILKCHKLTVVKYVNEGELPGRKVGKGYVFIKGDVAEFIRKGNNRRCLPMPERKFKWHCTKEETYTGSISQIQAEKELDALLAQPINSKRNSSLTN